MASIRLEAQAPPARGPPAVLDPPLRSLRHTATLSVVFVTAPLAAEQAALPVPGAAPR